MWAFAMSPVACTLREEANIVSKVVIKKCGLSVSECL